MVFFTFFDKGNEVTSDFPFSPHVSMHGGETKVTGVSRARPIAHIGFSREENTRKKENSFLPRSGKRESGYTYKVLLGRRDKWEPIKRNGVWKGKSGDNP